MNKLVLTSQEKDDLNKDKCFIINEIVGALTHQLKQPLNMIATSMIVLDTKAEFDQLDNAIVKKTTNRVNSSVQELSKDIDTFRNFFESSVYTAIDILAITKNTISLLQAQFSKHNMTINFDYKENRYIIDGYLDKYKQTLLHIFMKLKYMIQHNKLEDIIINLNLEKTDNHLCKTDIVTNLKWSSISSIDNFSIPTLIIEKIHKGKLLVDTNTEFVKFSIIL